MKNSEKAVELHKSFHSCSESVLCAFADDADLTEYQASAAAKPFAGGRMTKCGAVLAAQYVLAKKFGEDSNKLSQFEEEFIALNKSAVCRELKGALTGAPLRSCRGCVSDSAEILEKLLSE